MGHSKRARILKAKERMRELRNIKLDEEKQAISQSNKR
jgi:hypothetical protein